MCQAGGLSLRDPRGRKSRGTLYTHTDPWEREVPGNGVQTGSKASGSDPRPFWTEGGKALVSEHFGKFTLRTYLTAAHCRAV